MPRAWGLAAALALAGTSVAGCYASYRVPSGRPVPGQPVRLWLGEGGSASVVASVGPRASILDGDVLARSDSAVTLALRSVTRRGGSEETFPGDSLTVSLAAIDSATVRRFDRRRSFLLGAGVVAGAWLLRAFADEAGFTRTSVGKPGGTQ